MPRTPIGQRLPPNVLASCAPRQKWLSVNVAFQLAVYTLYMCTKLLQFELW
jgi:hypothetical protein